MFKEKRLIGLNLSDFKDQTVYNSRTANNNATVQDANANINNLQQQHDTIQQQRSDLLTQHQSGSISDEEYSRQNTVLTNSATRVGVALSTNITDAGAAAKQLGDAKTVYQNQSQGFGSGTTSSANAGDAYGSGTQTVGVAGDGMLQQSAINTIKAQHPEWTDAQIKSQIDSQTPGIQSTMSQGGQGMDYNAKGIAIPGTEGNMGLSANNVAKEAAKAKAASDAQINQIKGYKTIQIGTNKDGTIMYATVEDPAETSRLQQEARTAATTKAAADTNYAATTNANDAKSATPGAQGAGALTTDTGISAPPTVPTPVETPFTPNPDAFLAGLDALQKQNAGTVMAPLFDLQKQAYLDLQAKGVRGQALQDAIQAKTDAYVASQKADNAVNKAAWTKLADDAEQSSLESAQATYDQQTRLAQQQKANDQLDYEAGIRDQIIKNEEDRKALLLDNGISGGWRSSMHTGKMIDAFKKADLIVSDLRDKKVNNSDVWNNKLIDIAQNLHVNITQAYDAHNVAIQTLADKLNERAKNIDKTVFDSEIAQLNASDKNTEDFYTGVANITKDTTSNIVQINKDALAATDKAADNLRADRTQVLNEENSHITQFGDTDPAGWKAIQDRKAALGLPTTANIPSLSQTDKVAKQALTTLSSDMISSPKSTVGGVNYGLLGTNAFSSTKFSADEVQRGLTSINTLIKSGQIPEAKHQILNYTYQGMGIGQQNDITSSNNLVNEIGFMKSEMSQYSPTYGPFWTKLLQSAKPIAALQKDPQYVEFVAHVQRVLGEERHRLFGSALTATENTQADSYLFNPAEDTAVTLTAKLNKLSDSAQRSLATRYDDTLGSGAYSNLTGIKVNSGAPNTNSTPVAQPLTPQQEHDNLIKLWNSPPAQTSFNSPQPEGGKTSGKIATSTVGDRKVTGDQSALDALAKADADFFKDHGQHIFVNSSYRSHEQQQQAYDRFLKGEISRAAPPGKSLHEKGIAFDITNWKEAEQYLTKYGFNPLPKNIRSSDPAHFSFGTIG